MYNVDNDLRQPSPPVADDQPTSLALPHLTLVNHCRALKYILLSCHVIDEPEGSNCIQTSQLQAQARLPLYLPCTPIITTTITTIITLINVILISIIIIIMMTSQEHFSGSGIRSPGWRVDPLWKQQAPGSTSSRTFFKHF